MSSTGVRCESDTYDDFVAWRDDHANDAVTVGDAMTWFTGTPLDTLLAWWSRDERENVAC